MPYILDSNNKCPNPAIINKHNHTHNHRYNHNDYNHNNSNINNNNNNQKVLWFSPIKPQTMNGSILLSNDTLSMMVNL